MSENKLGLEFLKKLSTIPTAAFYEQFMHQEIEDIYCKHLADNPKINKTIDDFGNIIIHYKGDSNREHPKAIVYTAHTDHPAFHLQLLADGTYLAKMAGGLKTDYVLGSKLFLYNRNDCSFKITGRVTKVLDQGDGNPSKRYIVQVDDNNEQRVFDFATLPFSDFEIDANKIMHAPAMDDTVGIAMSLAALIKIGERDIAVDVYLVFHRAEEVGLIGAMAVAQSKILPKDAFVISLEASSYKAKRDRENETEEVKEIVKVGGGVVLRLGDRTIPNFNHAAITMLHAAAAFFEGSIQAARTYAGTCEAAPYYLYGYRAAGICLPLIGYHNDGTYEGKKEFIPEAVHVHDFDNGIEYMVKVVEKLVKCPDLYKDFGKHDITPEQDKVKKKLIEKLDGFSKDGFFSKD